MALLHITLGAKVKVSSFSVCLGKLAAILVSKKRVQVECRYGTRA